MYCKYCGKDIGNSLSCPYCNDGNAIKNTNSSGQNASTLNGATEKKTKFSQELKRKTKTLDTIDLVIIVPVAIFVVALQVLTIILILMDRSPNSFSLFEMLLCFGKIIIAPMLILCAIPKIFKLISKFSLRSLTKRYNPSDDELFENVKINGKYVILKHRVEKISGVNKFDVMKNKNAWECIAFSKDNEASKYIFLDCAFGIAENIIFAIIGSIFFSNFYAYYLSIVSFGFVDALLFLIRPISILFFASLIVLDLVLPAVFASRESERYKILKKNFIKSKQEDDDEY